MNPIGKQYNSTSLLLNLYLVKIKIRLLIYLIKVDQCELKICGYYEKCD